MPEIAMIVGSLNRDTPYFEPARGVGLSVFGFDPTTGRASLLSEDRSVDNPTFLSVAPASRWRVGAARFEPGASRAWTSSGPAGTCSSPLCPGEP